MTYQDTWAVCTECGKQFVFRVEEQRRLAERGDEIAPPEKCPACQPGATPAHRPQPRREPRSQPATTRKPQREAEELEYGPHEGSVKWYDTEKGYGFIVHSSSAEVFFHRTGLAEGEVPNFPDGTLVTYCIEQTDKGPQAVEVERMEGDTPTG